VVVAQVKTDDNGAMVETVEYLFDYASPWAYLADRMLANDSYTIAQGVDVSFRPIYLRGLEMFNKGLPYSSRKLAYIAQDLTRCTSFLGIEFSFPEVFPVNGLYALRAALAAQRHGCFDELHPALFHAAWRDGRNVSDPAEVLKVVQGAGLDEEVIGAGMVDDSIKQQLREQTAAAQGVPSFFVGDELFWGHDRLLFVERAATVPPSAQVAPEPNDREPLADSER